jgi:glutamyl-tRNA synthetase
MLRFAPSLTGDMDINDLRVALFNYYASKSLDENLIIRMQDMDKEKNIEGKDQEILDLLALFEIEYSQVIYQSENFRFHSAMALQLVHEKKAFSCFCSDEWLDKKRQEAKENKQAYSYDDACRDLHPELVIDNENPFTIRLNRPDKNITLNDATQGDISYDKDEIDSFVIMKQDKTPTYNFASAVDDMLNDISLVICTKDQIEDTPKQIHIRESLGYDKEVKYAHIANILSSSDNARDTTSVKWLLEEGYLPSAISNYLVSLANNAPQESFNISNISNSPTHFCLDTLKSINKEHLKKLDATELSRYVGFADANIGELAKVYLEEASTTKELRSKIEPIFASKEIPKEFSQVAKTVSKSIKDAPFFQEYDELKNYVLKDLEFNDEEFSKVFRYLLTGVEDGPDIASIYKYLKNYIGEIIK